MFNRQSLHIALLLWGCIFSLIAALCISMNKNFDKEKRLWLLCQQLTCSVLLLSDAFAWGYRGYPGALGSFVVHISNFLVFAFSDSILLLFHGYLCCYLFPDSPVRLRLAGGGKKEALEKDQPVIRIRAVTIIAVLALLLVVISQFTHLYYEIDAENLYHRNSGYMISLILPLSGMLTDLSLLIQYRKKISREILTAMLSYIVLPLIAAVILLFYYGISLVNLAISISMILMFIETTMEQMRFGDRIQFEENFETTNFKIPPLTVQPLVENAIKHGLTKPGRRGTVCVLTRQEKDAIIIEVTDDGIGFDTGDLEKNGSVGIKNIRYRLEHMAGAALQIESKPGEGTKAEIRIPAKQEREQ